MMGFHTPSPSILTSFIFLLPSLSTAISLDCTNIRVDSVSFNFKPLGGPKTLYTIDQHPPSYTNTTYTLDICQPLVKTGKKDEDCWGGSRACAIEYMYDPEGGERKPQGVVSIAGEYSHTHGGALDPKWTRLKSSPSNADRQKEGLRLEMHGGKYLKVKQTAIIEFLCLPDSEADEDVRRRDEFAAAGDDDDEDDDDGGEIDRSGEEIDDESGGKVNFLSWQQEEDQKVLRLEWHTKYACEDAKDSEGSSPGRWGFFTWFIIIMFMSVAAYLIFGTWLNYNRYSARGWDLVPHSETIRDIPYLFRDWMRSIINTVQGGGSRGGYSAV